jgi:hypothetical protein
VLRAGRATALGACFAELAEDDSQLSLALLHARVAAARDAQAAGLDGQGAVSTTWPTSSAGAAVVASLRDLLAQEHRASWSYPVVLAWSTDRSADAEAARADHARRTEQLADVLRLLAADPVPALATVPDRRRGTSRGRAGHRCRAGACGSRTPVAAGAAAVLAAAVEDGAPDWVRASVRCLAEAERARWSWGGAPAPWPGGGTG